MKYKLANEPQIYNGQMLGTDPVSGETRLIHTDASGNLKTSITGSLTKVSYEGVATTAEQTQSFVCTKEIVRLANDGTYDIQFNLDATVGAAGTFTVKAGEVENHIPVQSSVLHYQSIGGSSSFRALGV